MKHFFLTAVFLCKDGKLVQDYNSNRLLERSDFCSTNRSRAAYESVLVNCVLKHCTKVNSLLLRRNLTSVILIWRPVQLSELDESHLRKRKYMLSFWRAFDLVRYLQEKEKKKKQALLPHYALHVM